MSGLRIHKLKKTGGVWTKKNSIAKKAYETIGLWAIASSGEWQQIVAAEAGARLHKIAELLEKESGGNRYLIEQDNKPPPADLSEVNVKAYHDRHPVSIAEFGEPGDRSVWYFEEKATGDFSYMKAYGADKEGDPNNTPKREKRAARMFAMGLLTRCM